MVRYTPSRHYLSAGFLALALAMFSAWVGERWAPAFIPSVLFLFSGAFSLFLALQPKIEIGEECLVIGRRAIPWRQIRRLDRVNWGSPFLIVSLTLADQHRLLLIYPGDLESTNNLLRQLRRHSREALIDGKPHRLYWGDVPAPTSQERRQLPSPRYRLLRAEDEAEVERLYQRLKTVGHLDPKNSSEEK